MRCLRGVHGCRQRLLPGSWYHCLRCLTCVRELSWHRKPSLCQLWVTRMAVRIARGNAACQAVQHRLCCSVLSAGRRGWLRSLCCPRGLDCRQRAALPLLCLARGEGGPAACGTQQQMCMRSSCMLQRHSHRSPDRRRSAAPSRKLRDRCQHSPQSSARAGGDAEGRSQAAHKSDPDATAIQRRWSSAVALLSPPGAAGNCSGFPLGTTPASCTPSGEQGVLPEPEQWWFQVHSCCRSS